MRPRDQAKIAQLFLNNGRWGNEQIVTESWVKQSIQGQNFFWGPRRAYGYLWYSKTFGWRNSVDTFYASGPGGQKFLYAPDLSLVIVINTGNYHQPLDIHRQSYDIVARIIDIASDLGERFTDGS